MKPSERISVIAGQKIVSSYSAATAAEAIARNAQKCCDAIIEYLDEKYLTEVRPKKCNGAHCKCMNIGGHCPNHHYADCIEHNQKPIEQAYPEAYRLARRFHELYEEYAPQFGYETRKETKEFDPESPNGRLMAKVCHEVVQEEIDRLLERNIFKPL